MNMEFINFDDNGSRVYSDMVKLNDGHLYLSGLISAELDTGKLKLGTIAEETAQVLGNLKTILEKYGSDMNHIIRLQVLLSDFNERDEMNAEYVKHFDKEHLPSRLCYGVNGLASGCKIEIMADAVVK